MTLNPLLNEMCPKGRSLNNCFLCAVVAAAAAASSTIVVVAVDAAAVGTAGGTADAAVRLAGRRRLVLRLDAP